jgi:hypothetical protein
LTDLQPDLIEVTTMVTLGLHRSRGSSIKPNLSRDRGYDTFSNTSASHCGRSIVASWPVSALTKVCHVGSALHSASALSKADCGYFGART